MATIFISCGSEDSGIAKTLEGQMLKRGHRISLPLGTPMVGDWRAQVTRALVASRALIAILTERGQHAQNVLAEIGAGRALAQTKGMLILPVPFGIDDPSFIRDLYCYRLPSESEEDINTLAKTLDDAIASRATPRIFISHRHEDKKVAEALVLLLNEAFRIQTTDIRCTSLHPYALLPGVQTSEQIRAEIALAELVIGIVTPDTKESNYVLCELGAAWGRDVPSFPLLVKGAKPTDVPSPLNERNTISLESEENCRQLVAYVGKKTSLPRRDDGKPEEHAKLLSEAARP